MIYLALSQRGRNFQHMNAISHKNWLINKNPTIISSDTGKTCGKIQHVFIKKVLENVGLEGTYKNIIEIYI